MAVESYVRVRVADSDDAISVQRLLSDIEGYIGSFVVELESPDEAEFPFDIIVGFNGETTGAVDAAVEQAAGTMGVSDARDFRNRNLVPPSIGRPQ